MMILHGVRTHLLTAEDCHLFVRTSGKSAQDVMVVLEAGSCCRPLRLVLPKRADRLPDLLRF